ncbi:MAG: iron ABC transporter permease [Actinomycetota bacterium]|nr:iron ABC transporter permease [Actinomycetota bacterium]
MTRNRPPLALVVPAAAAALVAVTPIWYLVDRSLERGWGQVREELWRRRTFDLVARSLGLTAAVTIASVLLGVTAAWLVVRSDLPGRRALRVAFTLPLAIPSYLAAFAWISWRPGLAGFSGAALVLTLVSYPYVMLPAMAALSRLDPAQDDVARSLGRSRLSVALRLTLPQIRTSVAAGALLVALYVLSDFGAVAAMRYEAFTWVIYGAYRAGFNPSRAAILATVLVLLALVLVVAESRARGRASARVGSGTPRASTPVPLGRATPLAFAFSAAVLVPALGFPLWRISEWVRTYASTDVDLGDVFSALRQTLMLAALAAIATVALAFPAGVLAARSHSRLARSLERATYVAHGLPGIVVAISLVYVGVRLLRPIYLETPLLVLGYVVLFLPLAVGAVRSSVEQSPVRLEEVARSMGNSQHAVLRKVTAPLAAPGIGAGAALVLLTTMKELPVTLVLHPTGTETLATRLWRYTSVSDYANAGPYALALVAFAAVPTALLGASFNGRRHGAGVQ